MRPTIFDQALNRRTIPLIRKHIVKRGKQPIFRGFFRAKHDEKAVATWTLDLDEIHHVFDVRPFTSA